MADKKLNQVSQLTDFDYALVVKGNDVAKVTKQQLATILGGLIPTASNKNKGLVAPDMFSFTRDAVTDANGCSVFGSYKLSPGVLNAPDGIKYGDVLFAVPWDTNTIHQFIYTTSGGTYRRVGGKENWSEWVKD